MKKTQNNVIIPMIIIAGMFSVLGFAVGINAFFIPFVQNVFNITSGMSYLVTTATFSAFVIFGMPSGKILLSQGYKKSMSIAFIMMALGIFIVIGAAKWESFILFLTALFINGLGQTLLNTAVNPYITILGPENTAASRISVMGMCNKLSLGLAPIVLSMFIDVANVQIDNIGTPFTIITVILLVLGVLAYFAPLPEVEAEGENTTDVTSDNNTSSKRSSIFQFPHLVLGAIAIFFYVGAENIALMSINEYATELGLEGSERYALYTSVGYFLGYLMGIFLIPKIITQELAMKICSIIGIIAVSLIVTAPPTVSIISLSILGIANSLIWPTIWPLALADLGSFTKKGSALLVMGIAGGGILPPVLGFLNDWIGSYQSSYWILMPIYIYFLFYVLKGCKIRN